jgi:hypothetical protein
MKAAYSTAKNQTNNSESINPTVQSDLSYTTAGLPVSSLVKK